MVQYLIRASNVTLFQVDQGSSKNPPPPPPLPEYSSSSPTTSSSSAPSSVSKEAEEQAAAFSAVEASSLGSSTPPWGLDMMDQHSLPLDGLYHYSALGKSLAQFTHASFDAPPTHRSHAYIFSKACIILFCKPVVCFDLQ